MSEPTKQLISTAYHEAGHAVVATLLGFQFQHVTIAPDEDYLGSVLYERYTMFLNVGHRAYAKDLRDYLVANRAGPLAEERHTGHWNEDGASSDDQHFWSMLWRMYGERQDRHARDLTRQARQLVSAHWPSIERVARALIEEKTIQFDAVERLIQS